MKSTISDVPEVPGPVGADDVPTVLEAIAKLNPLLKMQTPGGGGGCLTGKGHSGYYALEICRYKI